MTTNNVIPFETKALDFSIADAQEDIREELPPGYASARAGIPKELNERLKAAARRQGKTALIYIGEVLMNCAAELDRQEAVEEAKRLKERFGDGWLDVIKAASADQ